MNLLKKLYINDNINFKNKLNESIQDLIVNSTESILNKSLPVISNEKNMIKINSNKLINYINNLSQFNSAIANNQSLEYHFNKSRNLHFTYLKAFHIIKLTFLSMGCLISKPTIKVVHTFLENGVNNKIIIRLFFYTQYNKSNINVLNQYNNKFQYLMNYLATIFNTEVELDIVKLNKPYYDAHILAQSLALKSYKHRFVRIMSKLFKKAHIYFPTQLDSIINPFPSFLSGVSITLAGRTFKQKIIPKKTVFRLQKGSITNVTLIQKARFTGKTRRGTYSFTVTLGHMFK